MRIQMIFDTVKGERVLEIEIPGEDAEITHVGVKGGKLWIFSASEDIEIEEEVVYYVDGRTVPTWDEERKADAKVKL